MNDSNGAFAKTSLIFYARSNNFAILEEGLGQVTMGRFLAIAVYGDDVTFEPGAFPLTATQSTARTRRIWANIVSNTTVDDS